MNEDAPPSQEPDSPESLFARWLARREAGASDDIEPLCRAHPDLAGELRELHRQLGRLEDLRRRFGLAGSVAERLTRRYGPDIDPGVELESEDDGAGDAAARLLGRLSDRGASSARYRLKGEVATGGMGAVLRVWDEDLRRHLAMKVMLGQGPAASAGTPPVDRRRLARFLEEAQVAGQLDHPGIVPVHELGLDADGRVFFTMKLVKGRELSAVFEQVAAGSREWTLLKALGVLLKVCEAMSYAHAKGVVHRDLKPANVMVGAFGEVYVMDWGLARVQGREDDKDIRPAVPDAEAPSGVRSDRREELERGGESPLLTMDGDVIGTPAYMPPEQAAGRIAEVDARSDVYAVGAMLYHLLAGRSPYVDAGERPGHLAVLARVLRGPPRPLEELAPSVPPELAAICNKAMARDASRRYADMAVLADDLASFLEGRVVRAFETGPWAEARKWVRRNRPLAAAAGTAALLLVVGLATSSTLYLRAQESALRASQEAQRAERKTVEAERNLDLAVENEARAREQQALAEEREQVASQRTQEVLRLSALQELEELTVAADALWPASEERTEELRAWLSRADALVGALPAHRRSLEELRARALPPSALEPGASRRASWSFTSTEDRWWHAQLVELVEGIERLRDPETGLIDGISPEHGWGVRRRLEFALGVRARTLEEHAYDWREAVASIRDPGECPAYGGLELRPQLGLIPLGRDPDSGLWEFADVLCGEAPERDLEGRLSITERTGLVLVLLPGGEAWIGAQKEDPSAIHFDPAALPDESPVHRVWLEPFLISKYEMTQAQWQAFSGHNPAVYGPGSQFGGRRADLLHPVEQVDWHECARLVARMGLELPTEAQWEYAARAGSGTPWCTGAEAASLEGCANLSDATFKRSGGPAGWQYETWDDGWGIHAPVGSYAANAFGLHDVHGNVFEWCRDGYGSYELPTAPGNGERLVDDPTARVYRGGSFYVAAVLNRCALRVTSAADSHNYNLGLRPSRRLR